MTNLTAMLSSLPSVVLILSAWLVSLLVGLALARGLISLLIRRMRPRDDASS